MDTVIPGCYQNDRFVGNITVCFSNAFHSCGMITARDGRLAFTTNTTIWWIVTNS